MPQKLLQPLIGQLSHFAVENDISKSEWEMAATEFGVHDTATNIDRFYRSWNFGDDDQQSAAVRFLRKIADDDEDTALGIMQRIYMMADPSPGHLERYPALELLEDANSEATGSPVPGIPIHSEQFLDIDNVPGTFYPELVENINRCFTLGIYDATLVLTRKLLENLLIDILRAQYGKQKINLFYIPERKQFQNFDTLINNFADNLNDFEYLGGLDGDFVKELDGLRQDANVEAHSIETNITEQEINDYQERAKHASQVLFRVRQNL